MSSDKIKCGHCKTYKIFALFIGTKGDVLKTCSICRLSNAKSKKRNKCEHNRQKNMCIECNGSGICIHKIQRNRCKECGDAEKITKYYMIHNARLSDTKYGRYDPVNFIDNFFVDALLEDYPYCYYDDCNVDLQYTYYQDDLATIERLDNNIGHTKRNVVICCMRCNKLKKSDK